MPPPYNKKKEEEAVGDCCCSSKIQQSLRSRFHPFSVFTHFLFKAKSEWRDNSTNAQNANLENNFTPLCITRTIIMTKTRDIPKAKCQILSIKFDGFLINVSDKFRTHHESQTKHILSIIVFFRVQLGTLTWVWYSFYERNAIFHQFCTDLKIYIF